MCMCYVMIVGDDCVDVCDVMMTVVTVMCCTGLFISLCEIKSYM